ncbi:DUF4328 domain-containing protein [Streptomyces mauvecolor]
MNDQQQDTRAGVSQAGPPQYRRVTGAATAAKTLILLTSVGSVLDAVSDWRTYSVVHDYLAGSATGGDLGAADSFSRAVALPAFVANLAAAVVFLVWLWRARINSESSGGPGSHRHKRGMVVYGWMTPVANLWIPYRVVSDIWRASAPRRNAPRGLVTTWWVLFAADTALSPALARYYHSKPTEPTLRTTADLSTASAVLEVVAGVLIIVIIARVTRWQTATPPAAE